MKVSAITVYSPVKNVNKAVKINQTAMTDIRIKDELHIDAITFNGKGTKIFGGILGGVTGGLAGGAIIGGGTLAGAAAVAALGPVGLGLVALYTLGGAVAGGYVGKGIVDIMDDKNNDNDNNKPTMAV